MVTDNVSSHNGCYDPVFCLGKSCKMQLLQRLIKRIRNCALHCATSHLLKHHHHCYEYCDNYHGSGHSCFEYHSSDLLVRAWSRLWLWRPWWRWWWWSQLVNGLVGKADRSNWGRQCDQNNWRQKSDKPKCYIYIGTARLSKNFVALLWALFWGLHFSMKSMFFISLIFISKLCHV